MSFFKKKTEPAESTSCEPGTSICISTSGKFHSKGDPCQFLTLAFLLMCRVFVYTQVQRPSTLKERSQLLLRRFNSMVKQKPNRQSLSSVTRKKVCLYAIHLPYNESQSAGRTSYLIWNVSCSMWYQDLIILMLRFLRSWNSHLWDRLHLVHITFTFWVMCDCAVENLCLL